MNADAEFNASLRRQAGIALDHAGLHLDGASHSVDNAAEINEKSVAGALDHTPMMHGDGRINQIAPEPPEPRQSTLFVRTGEARIAGDISCENSCQLTLWLVRSHAGLPS